tara:strand:- start:60163 stop:63483 length:3321 start_codon:yes stop_codon:yes gene_type:complete
MPREHNHSIPIWHETLHKTLSSLNRTEYIFSLSSDGNTVGLYDEPLNQVLIFQVVGQQIHPEPFYWLAVGDNDQNYTLSPDGQLLVFSRLAGRQIEIHIHYLLTTQAPYILTINPTYQNTDARISRLMISHDHRFVVAAKLRQGSSVIIDSYSQRCIDDNAQLYAEDAYFGPNSYRLYTTDCSRLSCYDIERRQSHVVLTHGRQHHDIQRSLQYPDFISISPNQRLACFTFSTIDYVIDLVTKKILRQPHYHQTKYSIFSADSKRLIRISPCYARIDELGKGRDSIIALCLPRTVNPQFQAAFSPGDFKDAKNFALAADGTLTVLSDTKIGRWQLPQRLTQPERYQYNITNDTSQPLTIPANDLLNLAYDCIAPFLQKAGDYQQAQLTNLTTIDTPNDWLKTAGHFSIYATGLDRRFGHNHSAQQRVAGQVRVFNLTTVQINRPDRGDAIVVFNMCGGSYPAISQYLLNIQQYYQCPDANIAKLLQDRINGVAYPDAIIEVHQTFFDTLLVLMLVVEGSRNNVTFLTTLLLLDLILSGQTYGHYGSRAFGLYNLFVSGPGYVWNDYESIDADGLDYGGKFPMATTCTGGRNFADRRQFIQGQLSLDTLLLNPQRHRVPLRELRLMIHWLSDLNDERLTELSACETNPALSQKIIQLLTQRLSIGFGAMSYHLPHFPLQIKPHSASPHIPSVLPDRGDTICFYLWHRATSHQRRQDNYYHRIDVPCKNISGYICNEEEKSVTRLRSATTMANIHLGYKELSAMTRHCLTPRFDNIIHRVYLEHRDYHFVNAGLHQAHETTIRGDYAITLTADHYILEPQQMAEIEAYIEQGIITQVIEETIKRLLSWPSSPLARRDDLNGRDPSAGHYIRDYPLECIQLLADTPWHYDENSNTTTLYIEEMDQLLIARQLQAHRPLMLQMLLDEEATAYACRIGADIRGVQNIDKKNPAQVHSDDPQANNVVDQVCDELIGNDRWYVKKFIYKIIKQVQFNAEQHFTFFTPEHESMKNSHGELLLPCPRCYNDNTEAYPALAYPHNPLPCIIADNVQHFHRIDSQCPDTEFNRDHYRYNIRYYQANDTRHQPARLSFVQSAIQQDKQACPYCWLPVE